MTSPETERSLLGKFLFVIFILLPFILLGFGYFLVTIPEKVVWLGVKQTVWFGVGQSVIASALVSLVMLIGLWAERKSSALTRSREQQLIEEFISRADTLGDTGIRAVFDDRYSYIRSAYQRYQANVSEQLDLLGMSLTHFQQDVGEQLIDWLNERPKLQIRLLLLNPNSSYGRTRDLEEGNHEGHIAEWSLRLTEKVLLIDHPRLQVRWYNTLPSANVYRLDQIVFVGNYLVRRLSRQTPTFELDVNGRLAKPYLQHFEDLWKPPKENENWSVSPKHHDVDKAKARLGSDKKRRQSHN